jgi:hypothetical protein
MKPFMQRVCYMNMDKEAREENEVRWAKKDSYGMSPCDWTWEFYSRWYQRDFQRDLIARLEPDIFIITGVTPGAAGYELISHIYKHDEHYNSGELWLNDKNNNFKTLGKTLFVSIKHPGARRDDFSWEYIVDTVEKIKENVSG